MQAGMPALPGYSSVIIITKKMQAEMPALPGYFPNHHHLLVLNEDSCTPEMLKKTLQA
jgi:hypothetical protein